VDKGELRRRLRARRAERWVLEHAAADRARLERLLELTDGASSVAVYLSVEPEPDTLQFISSLPTGVRVLVPYLSASPDWAEYSGPDSLKPGPHGIPQPDGRRLGVEALADADVIVLPGLAATRGGTRLGQGGGWYDRALVGTKGKRVLLLNHDEIVDQLPSEPWDLPVDVIVTEKETIQARDFLDGSHSLLAAAKSSRALRLRAA
jgi:5-formyltetrahydrofolate cyclo-ligase